MEQQACPKCGMMCDTDKMSEHMMSAHSGSESGMEKPTADPMGGDTGMGTGMGPGSTGMTGGSEEMPESDE